MHWVLLPVKGASQWCAYGLNDGEASDRQVTEGGSTGKGSMGWGGVGCARWCMHRVAMACGLGGLIGSTARVAHAQGGNGGRSGGVGLGCREWQGEVRLVAAVRGRDGGWEVSRSVGIVGGLRRRCGVKGGCRLQVRERMWWREGRVFCVGRGMIIFVGADGC